jgi:hypothetical protein
MTSPQTTRVRLAALVAVSVLALPLLGAGAHAAPTEVCNPDPKTSSSFCVTFDATIGPTLNARDPFDADISFANTSNAHQTDQTKWLDTVTVHLAASNTSAPGIVPSAQLPDMLVIAGNDGDCTSPTFANCDAGHGVFVVNVSNTGIPLVDGDHTGTFGVRRIVNLAGAPAGALKYRVDLGICASIPPFGDCAIQRDYSEVVQSPIPAGSGGGSLDISLPVYQEGDEMVSGQNAHYKGTLDSGELHLKGTADKLQDGTSVGPFQVFKLPARCGSVTGSGEFTSHETPTPRTVEIATPPVVFGGCPTAAFTRILHGAKVNFDGSSSAAHVSGRTVKTWRWVFGDGTHLTRIANATAAHVYPLSPAAPTNYKVTLVVLDSKGAISLPETGTIQGTATKVAAPVKSPTQVKVPGTVAPFLAGQHVKVTLQRRQGDTFHTVGIMLPELNGASQYTAIFSPRPPAGMCRAIARYPGDAAHLASSQTKAFSC